MNARKLGEYTSSRTPHIIVAALDGIDLSLVSAQRRYIEMIVALVGGSIPAAAKVLRVSRRFLERHGFRASQSPPRRAVVRRRRAVAARRARK